ncbi:MAG: enoyl-CoA hydratase [Oscillospiraceae bacterium]|nr:enoyl-CoA hydratase [Oscillospiraceae bacterium]
MEAVAFNRKTVNDIQVGDRAYFARTVTEADVMMFAQLSGDFAPQHVSKAFGETTLFGSRIAHGMLTVGLTAPVLTKLCGDASRTVFQNIRFRSAVILGDTVDVEGVVTEIDPDEGIVSVDITAKRHNAAEGDRPFITGIFRQTLKI